MNKAKFISLISTAVLATASSGVFADETTPVIDGSTSPTVSVTPTVPTDKSTDKAPDPNKVTDKAPEAKPSTEKQAAATETEALPHTGDDTALTVSLTSLGAFLIAAGLGFLPKRKKD